MPGPFQEKATMLGTQRGRVRLITMEWAGSCDHAEDCNLHLTKKGKHGMVVSSIMTVSRLGIPTILLVLEGEGESRFWKTWYM